MVVFFGCVTICFVISWIIACKWGKDSVAEGSMIATGVIIGIVLGIFASFWGGSLVKKEIIVEKYFISPMFFDRKIIVGLVEYPHFYTLQIKEGDKTRLIKHDLYEKNILFTCKEDEKRYLEIKRSKACRKNMWIWFFYRTGFIESKAVLKNGDGFLTVSRYCPL